MRSENFRLFMIAFLALALALPGTAYGQATQGLGLLKRGPAATGPLRLFPAWFMDTNGLALEGCVDGPPLCLSSLADLANPAIGEAFYWSAIADLVSGGATASVEFALEMAFLNPVINRANAMVFNRMRVRANGLPSAGPFTMVHPFGTAEFTATPERRLTTFEINETVDLPGTNGPVSFSGVLRAPNIGPFLRHIGAPPGFIGNPNVPRRVTGGPNGNAVTITGGGLTMTTNLFLVEGKIATNGGLNAVRATYARNLNGNGTVNVSASSIGQQRIMVRLGTRPNQIVRRMVPIAGQVGRYSRAIPFIAAQAFEPLIVTNVTDAGRPSVSFANVPDVITIRTATFQNGTLTVFAESSDRRAPRPVLRLFDNAGTLLALRAGRINVSITSPVNPGRVRVVSSAGGVATSLVR